MRNNWFRLDTAALIFPTINTSSWSNVFRVSVQLDQQIDPVILQHAVDDLKNRFPSYYVSIKPGFFWYYLQQLPHSVTVQKDYAYPLTHMSKAELRNCCFRVFYYKNRIAVEFFHSVTDGTGGSIYLRSLVARYLQLKEGIKFTPDKYTLAFDQQVNDEDLEDSFHKNSSGFSNLEHEKKAFHYSNVTPVFNFLTITTGLVSSKQLRELAHKYNVTVTMFLSAVLVETMMKIQNYEKPLKKQRNVNVSIPINLRKLYNSSTLRNFVLSLRAGVDPKCGPYTLEELCQTISHQMKARITKQYMSGQIASNVLPQQNPFIKLVPLVIKRPIMSLFYNVRGENPETIGISNLGVIDFPKEIQPHIQRVDFIIGVQLVNHNNCSVACNGDLITINMTRNIEESEIERLFFSRLVELGLDVKIECNKEG